jgi:hypothetical protein
MQSRRTTTSRNKENGKAALAATNKQNRVLEAVKEGLLQVHGTAPNMKQQGIFCIMGKNCNGFNNQISGNKKIKKDSISRRILILTALCTASIASTPDIKITKMI